MLTLFIPFLLNMETFAWLMPLVHAPAQLCTYAGCTRAQEDAGSTSIPGKFPGHRKLSEEQLLPAHWIPQCCSLSSRQVQLHRNLCGNSWRVAGRLRELEREERRPQNGESLTQDPVYQGQSPAASLSAASQDRQAPPVLTTTTALLGAP